jgi:hypothetical protein
MINTNLENIAFSRIAEPLSRGENVKKLLSLHVSPYSEQTTNAVILENLKNLDKSYGTFIDWFGVLKGVARPHTTIDSDKINNFLNLFNGDKLGFNKDDISKPLYFNQKNYFKVGDLYFKRIIETYCNLTNFKGTVDEYSYIFKEVFGVDVQIRVSNWNLEFILENSNTLTIDYILIQELTPTLPQTKNTLFISPYNLFSLEFDNIKGTNLDFNDEKNSSFYFSF